MYKINYYSLKSILEQIDRKIRAKYVFGVVKSRLYASHVNKSFEILLLSICT